MIYLDEKEALLRRNDSFLTEFLKRANLKFKLGDINVLEKSGAENQRNKIAIQLSQLENDRYIARMRLQLLLNSSQTVLPQADSLKYTMFAIDSTAMINHPELARMWQMYQANLSKTKLNTSKLLPDITLGYANMSMKGTGADNRFYSGSTRFQSFQVGVAVPIFSGAQRALVNASKTEAELAKNDFEAGKQNMTYQWQSALQLHQHYLDVLKLYESGGLQNARTMKDAADKQFESGAIDYLDWVMVISQYLSIESDYLDAVNAYNENIIQIEYLSGQ